MESIVARLALRRVSAREQDVLRHAEMRLRRLRDALVLANADNPRTASDRTVLRADERQERFELVGREPFDPLLEHDHELGVLVLLVRKLLVDAGNNEPFFPQLRDRIEDRHESRRCEKDVVVAVLSLVAGDDGAAHLTPQSGVCLDVWIS